MKFIKRLSIFFVILMIAFFVLGFFAKSINYKIDIKLQSPIAKAYNSLASHELKPKLYSNISDQSKVNPYKTGNASTFVYQLKNEEKSFVETVLSMDSLKQVSYSTTQGNKLFISTIDFIDRDKLTYLNIQEKVESSSIIERAMLIILKSQIIKARTAFYTRIKNHIESTPDYNFQPEERK